ncbi:MAG TPA: histidine triad nucleotide-binding protein [Gemmatimonadaceae bacterium]|jgi:histidine triad (HIT) family protein|nr:histidine triad nucleotide-binding protein [Gemmatimonadaceae bacterium]
MSDEATCLFCRIVRHEIPAKIVSETPDTIAFRDINPQAPQHILVIPRRHVANLNALDDPALVGKLSAAATDIARTEGFADSGYRIVINTLADGGQTVDHLHLHLLGGRHMQWPPG